MARNFDDVLQARVASRYLERTAASVFLDSRAQFAGRGDNEGWTLTISTIHPDRDGYAVTGGLWWQKFKREEERATFTADLRDRRGKFVFDHIQWEAPFKAQWPQGNFPTRLAERVTKISGLKASQVSLRSLVEELFPPSLMGPGGYKGKLTVVPLAGPVRNGISDQTLRQYGGHTPFGNGYVTALPPVATPEAAEAAAGAEKTKYERDHWPGGMASVVGLVKWTDFGSWSGLVSSYYSPS